MTTPSALRRPTAITLRRRVAARLAVALARLLGRLPPRRIRAVLQVLCRGARPAGYQDASDARAAVLAVSLACLGPQGCLPRSLAVALLCRMGGRWPTWCVGVRAMPPFGAHAWVEADGQPVDEGVPAGYFRPLIAVPPTAGPPTAGSPTAAPPSVAPPTAGSPSAAPPIAAPPSAAPPT